MIEEIRIENFRHFEEVIFRPHEHTSLLCGLNGTGKSTIVELMSRLQGFLIHGAPVGALFRDEDITLWNKDILIKQSASAFVHSEHKVRDEAFYPILFTKAPLLIVWLNINNTHMRYITFARYICEKERYYVAVVESLSYDDKTIYSSQLGSATVFTDNDKENYKIDPQMSGLRLAANANPDIQAFLDYFRTNIFALSIDPLSMNISYEKLDEHLDLNAQNFPAWYAYQTSKSVLAMTSCFPTYKSFIPGFVEMLQDPRRTPVELEAKIEISSDKNYKLPFASFSHGQKILCVLYTVIKLAPQGSTIFIDEFENYLAPTELVPLYCAMQDAFEERGVQFVLVSHHQKTLNWFRDSAFILTFSKNKPSVQIAPFDAEQHGEIYDYLKELLDD